MPERPRHNRRRGLADFAQNLFLNVKSFSDRVTVSFTDTQASDCDLLPRSFQPVRTTNDDDAAIPTPKVASGVSGTFSGKAEGIFSETST